MQSKDGIIDLPHPVRVRLVYSCTPKSGGKNEYIGEFVVRHLATADYVVAECDVGDDGENWAEQCTEQWTSAENEKTQDFEAWQGQDAQRCEECGGGGRVGKKMKPRAAPARMALLGNLIDTDFSTPIMLARDCVHRDGGPHRMLTLSLDAQLATCQRHVVYYTSPIISCCNTPLPSYVTSSSFSPLLFLFRAGPLTMQECRFNITTHYLTTQHKMQQKLTFACVLEHYRCLCSTA